MEPTPHAFLDVHYPVDLEDGRPRPPVLMGATARAWALAKRRQATRRARPARPEAWDVYGRPVVLPETHTWDVYGRPVGPATFDGRSGGCGASPGGDCGCGCRNEGGDEGVRRECSDWSSAANFSLAARAAELFGGLRTEGTMLAGPLLPPGAEPRSGEGGAVPQPAEPPIDPDCSNVLQWNRCVQELIYDSDYQSEYLKCWCRLPDLASLTCLSCSDEDEGCDLCDDAGWTGETMELCKQGIATCKARVLSDACGDNPTFDEISKCSEPDADPESGGTQPGGSDGGRPDRDGDDGTGGLPDPSYFGFPIPGASAFDDVWREISEGAGTLAGQIEKHWDRVEALRAWAYTEPDLCPPYPSDVDYYCHETENILAWVGLCSAYFTYTLGWDPATAVAYCQSSTDIMTEACLWCGGVGPYTGP